MERRLIASLPGPVAHALESFLDEDLPRSADELSELLVATIEYVGAVALADYLGGSEIEGRCATDPALNSWLISQLATGKAEAGHWARWTQLAVRQTPEPAVPCLTAYVAAQDLDDPDSDLAWLLRFRNGVMHGGFVAPLPKIRSAARRMTRLFELLDPLWRLRLVGKSEGETGPTWRDFSGLLPTDTDPPKLSRDRWQRDGFVALVDDAHHAVLGLDPACEIDAHGALHLQHNWRTHHHGLFERPAVHAFFERYSRQRRGLVEATRWIDAVAGALPERGRVPHGPREHALLSALRETPGAIVRLCGPVGSGRSTLLQTLHEVADRPVALYPVTPNSVLMDPQVLARWTLQALSLHAFGEPAPPEALVEGAKGKKAKAQQAWFDRLEEALEQHPAPILVVDDADLVGSGLYSGTPTSGCLRFARRFGAPVVLVHTPSSAAPEKGDAVVEMAPWGGDELASWGDAAALALATGGHAELLADPDTGLSSLRARLEAAFEGDALKRAVLGALMGGPATVHEVADALQTLTPRVELTLRALLDHLVSGERALDAAGEPVRTYALYPAVRIALQGRAS